ncbi:hypothetical protein [Flavobacterium pectinovorum]|uniref:hypothetical protein n=1 Tax=Flavobacterium pectinovorum TaxID=29533 RepID=UPI001375F4EC|nr:hypothetical protein [Flavobacterium pectinovorum]
MKKKISLVFFLISYFSFAQGPPPPGLPDEPEPVPINQEIGLLFMAGIALGVYVINKKK